MKNIKINITFDKFSFGNFAIKSIIKTCIHATMKQQGVNAPYEINVLVTDDTVIREINKSTREIDKATDVLSFPMFQFEPGVLPEDWTMYLDPGSGRCPLGDMAISLERAVAQAQEFGHSTKREVGYLTIHSMLHLLGYDHLDEGEQKAQMRAEEEKIVSEIPGMQR